MARKSYSKEDHITYLIKEYIQYIANKSAEVEHYLHLTLSLKKLPMLFCFNYQRLNYFV